MYALGQLAHFDALQFQPNRREVGIAQDLPRQPVQFWRFGWRNLHHPHDQWLWMVNEVDVVVQSLDDERTFWSDTEFVRHFSQRRTIGRVNVRAFGKDACFRQGQYVNGGDGRKQWFAFCSRDRSHGMLPSFSTQHDKICTTVGLTAEQQRSDGIYRHRPMIRLHTDPAVWQWNQITHCLPFLRLYSHICTCFLTQFGHLLNGVTRSFVAHATPLHTAIGHLACTIE